MKQKPIDLITKTRVAFFACVAKCNAEFRDKNDLLFYRNIIEQHRSICDIRRLIAYDEFLSLMYQTLIEWNMNQRGARLVPLSEFISSIRKHEDPLHAIYQNIVFDMSRQELLALQPIFETLFMNLSVMRSNRKVVGVSKTLHYLLPDLVLPIDSKYTMNYFYGYNKYKSDAEKEFNDFMLLVEASRKIIQNLDITPQDVDGNHWNTSAPKLIDNALIGFDKFLTDVLKERISEEQLFSTLRIENEVEQAHLHKILDKKRKNDSRDKRRAIRTKLLIEKAIAAGITVSEDEINEELRKAKYSQR